MLTRAITLGLLLFGPWVASSFAGHSSLPTAPLTTVPLISAVARPAPSAEALAQARRLSGLVRVGDFEVGENELVLVTDDLRLEATGRIAIRGVLWVDDRADSRGPIHGTTIELVAGSEISITGLVHGGQGLDRCGPGERGGTGSTIALMAPLIWVDGEVHGGRGGASGPGMKGGAGGSVDTFGGYYVHDHAAHPTAAIYGGTGGPGGSSGDSSIPNGAGGSGGSAIAHANPFPELAPDAPSSRSGSEESFTFETCPGGATGKNGGWAFGGSGGAGAAGHGGTNPPFPGCGAGGNGGPGGDGGDGVAFAGGVGGGGSNCCPLVGGSGGTGGQGGSGFGGPGGLGGTGGCGCVGYNWEDEVPVIHPHGAGGPGGPGGDGYGGAGGTGGNGGPRTGGSGSGGAGGDGYPGSGGATGSVCGGPFGLPLAPSGFGYPGAAGNVGCLGQGCL
jgi:hypothetical protein